MKIILRHKDYCDKCSQLENIGTLAGHKRCKIYKTVMLPREDLEITSRGQGSMLRPDKCKIENEIKVKPRIDLEKKTVTKNNSEVTIIGNKNDTETGINDEP